MKSMRDVRGETGVVMLERDNWQFGEWSILCDGYRVYLSCQPRGEPPSQHIEIPKSVFDRMVDAYTAPQKRTKKTGS